jgi:hypothetical protein
MSDFGAVLEYALALEAEAPATSPTLAAMRPSFMPPTKEMKEKAEKDAKEAKEAAEKAERDAGAPKAHEPASARASERK